MLPYVAGWRHHDLDDMLPCRANEFGPEERYCPLNKRLSQNFQCTARELCRERLGMFEQLLGCKEPQERDRGPLARWASALTDRFDKLGSPILNGLILLPRQGIGIQRDGRGRGSTLSGGVSLLANAAGR